MKTKNELFKQLSFHDSEHKRIDKELANLCISEIQQMMNDGKYSDAKQHVYKFYQGFSDFTFEKDLILVSINSKITLASINFKAV